jgi:predicted secreted Zn-dependent protease
MAVGRCTSILLAIPVIAGAQGDPKPRPMPRGVVVQAGIERYPVSGATVEQITSSLRGALDQEGGFAGHWSVGWRYSYRFGENVSSKAGCRTQNVRVDMQTKVRVPDWKTSSEAAPDVAAAWEKFTLALEDHIREHENIAIRTAGDLVQRLERMTDMSCNQLRLDIEREARSMSERLQERHRKFDADTRQGASAGARWPPLPPPPALSVRSRGPAPRLQASPRCADC